MNASDLIVAKKELGKIQKALGKELAKGKYKDTVTIIELKKKIKAKKIAVGDITKSMLLQLDTE
ncbi:MAG: hypothetical protein FWG10_02795 [Eubacteriaceae bacterium]|nr:hypothetical protein [Eubacteriaceae bacterium]